MRSKFTYALLLGSVLFAIEQLEYLLSGFRSLRILAGDVQWYIAFLLIAITITYYLVKIKREDSGTSLRGVLKAGLFISLIAGLLWAIFYSLYVWLLNPDYPNIMAWRYIPVKPKPEETTILTATMEFLLHPVAQLIIKPLFCVLSGMVGVFIDVVIQHKKQHPNVDAI